MAQLNSSNIVNGNVISTSDILQLYNALTAGGGTTGVYNVSLSGSITGSATSSSFATTSSYSVSSSYALSSSYAVTSSHAITASYAVNGGIATQVAQQAYSNDGGGPLDANFKFYAGKVRIISNTANTAAFPGLAGKTLGTNVWVTATIEGQASTFPSDIVTVRSLAANGTLTIETNSVPDATAVHFHVIYVP